MNKKSTIIYLFVLLSAPIFSQTETCLYNLDHPNLRTMIQVSSPDTIFREYILHIPANYNADIATPLIINLHGFGDCASDYYDDVGKFFEFNDLADSENFIVAYPQGAYRPEKEDTYWEPGDNGSSDLYENDVYFLEQLVLDIKSELNVDLNKVYACGYSNGGMMAYSLACNSGDIFSGIGIMSGTMLEEDCNTDQSIPIIIFHGIADEVLPYDGSIWYQSVSEVVNFWLDKNDIPSNSLISTELNDGKVDRDEYFGDNGNCCLTLYTVHEEWDKEAGHVWLSDQINGATPNKIMWDFFNGSCSPLSSVEDEFESNLNLKVSPNPFTNQINIESEFLMNQKFRIYNIQGNFEMSGRVNSNPYTIDLTSLPPNIYILNINGKIRKVVKMK